jgi:hypothetical protein
MARRAATEKTELIGFNAPLSLKRLVVAEARRQHRTPSSLLRLIVERALCPPTCERLVELAPERAAERAAENAAFDRAFETVLGRRASTPEKNA